MAAANKREFPKPRLVTLGRESLEFQAVKKELERSTSRLGCFSLDCIQRVENAEVEAMFEARVASLISPFSRLKLIYGGRMLENFRAPSLPNYLYLCFEARVPRSSNTPDKRALAMLQDSATREAK